MNSWINGEHFCYPCCVYCVLHNATPIDMRRGLKNKTKLFFFFLRSKNYSIGITLMNSWINGESKEYGQSLKKYTLMANTNAYKNKKCQPTCSLPPFKKEFILSDTRLKKK